MKNYKIVIEFETWNSEFETWSEIIEWLQEWILNFINNWLCQTKIRDVNWNVVWTITDAEYI